MRVRVTKLWVTKLCERDMLVKKLCAKKFCVCVCVCVCGKVVCDKVACERETERCERLCVTELCVCLCVRM